MGQENRNGGPNSAADYPTDEGNASGGGGSKIEWPPNAEGQPAS